MANERILVVDDEPGVRSALRAILLDEGFRVDTAESGEDGLEVFRRGPHDAVLLDVWLPGIDGLETLRQLRDLDPDAVVVMISGHGTIETAVRATKLGAFDFVEKPLSLDRTLLVLGNALRQRRLEQRNRQLIEQLSRDTEIIGTSAAAGDLRRAVRVAADSDAPLLLCGERGAGRETIARRVHRSGSRARAAFVEVPGASLAGDAVERTLYGEQGHRGRIALAAGGTLLLEEVHRLAPPLQRRLAETLSREVRAPQGLRVMATARPRAEELTPELAQFLDVLRIDVPSLRQRREDVPLIAERFMGDLSREYGREPKRLGTGCLAALKAHDWPGNLRELGNVIERVLLLAPGEEVRVEDLPAELGGARPPAEDLYGTFDSLEQGRRAFERYYVARVLAEERGDRVAAARRLGIEPDELEARLAAG